MVLRTRSKALVYRAGLASAVVALAACKPRDSEASASSILLFNGRGTSSGGVAAIERILDDNHLSYSTADSSRLSAMSEAQFAAYRLLIVPGGNFEEMGNHLGPETATRIRTAVSRGLNYFGICAGAFYAGDSPYAGLNLTGGVRFRFYSLEDRGIRKAVVPIERPAGPTLEQYWEDGPALSGWGDVVARYPDGSAAIVEGSYGSGWLILVGVHPEAPENWRQGMTFTTPTAVNHRYAATLIGAALNRETLPHF